MLYLAWPPTLVLCETNIHLPVVTNLTQHLYYYFEGTYTNILEHAGEVFHIDHLVPREAHTTLLPMHSATFVVDVCSNRVGAAVCVDNVFEDCYLHHNVLYCAAASLSSITFIVFTQVKAAI